MRRILLAAAMLAASLAAALPAQAGWGHHCGFGWGGYGGYHHCGYGGYGYGGYGYGGFGYRGCGFGGCGYGPYYGGYGCYSSYLYRPSYVYGGYALPYYYNPTPIGYYGGFYGSTYNASANFNALAVSPNLAAPAALPLDVRNLLTVDRGSLLARAESGADLRLPSGLKVSTITLSKPTLTRTNVEQRRKADQALAQGDVLFREQKFQAALQRYKLASQLAPDMAETYWRQGHGLIATGNYELAGGAFKRALALDPDTGRDGFTLDRLYGPAAIAKAAHVEGLAAWALEHSGSSEPYFLMGVTLHYDGQRQRAARFFARAADMAGAAGGYIASFSPLEVPALAAPVAPPAAPLAAPARPVVEKKVAPAVPVSVAIET